MINSLNIILAVTVVTTTVILILLGVLRKGLFRR